MKRITPYIKSLFRYNILKKKIPLNVSISLTNKCQLSCVYCRIPQRKQKEMTTKEIIQIINDLSKNETQRISLNGGEPLLHKDLDIIINKCKEKNIFTSLTTNGLLVSQKIKSLKKLDLLIISLDGNKNIQDSIRGKSFDKIIKGIKKARENNIVVWISTVLSNKNFFNVDFLLKKAEELDFYVSFQIVHHIDTISGKTNKLLLTREKYQKLINRLLSYKKINKRHWECLLLKK